VFDNIQNKMPLPEDLSFIRFFVSNSQALELNEQTHLMETGACLWLHFS